jgi:hypothetical protein
VIDDGKLRRVPMTDLTTPTTGMFSVYVGYWWPVTDDDCLLFYRPTRRSGYGSPQCNSDRRIAEKVSGIYPMPTTLQQVPIVFVPLDPSDY